MVLLTAAKEFLIFLDVNLYLTERVGARHKEITFSVAVLQKQIVELTRLSKVKGLTKNSVRLATRSSKQVVWCERSHWILEHGVRACGIWAVHFFLVHLVRTNFSFNVVAKALKVKVMVAETRRRRGSFVFVPAVVV